MQLCASALSLVPILCAYAQVPAPDAAAQRAIIARMKEAAATYNDRLQDFLLNQAVTRGSVSIDEGKRWQPLKTQKQGRTTAKTLNLDKAFKNGYFLFAGEFGALPWVFDPKAKAEFEWDHGELSGGNRLCVFRYSIAKPRTNFVFTVDREYLSFGHHGFVAADCGTGTAGRIHVETDPGTVRIRGRDVPVGLELDIRYAPVTIASQEFLLPQAAEETALFDNTRTKTEVKFQP